MIDLYPETEPYEQGFLEVDHGNLVYWETFRYQSARCASRGQRGVSSQEKMHGSMIDIMR